MSVLHGGKSVHGATVGILMLDSRFPRIPGDVGNALTWPFPVHYRVVEGATPAAAVFGDARALRDRFVEEGLALVRVGCDGIVTSCGLLAPIQDDLRAALGVPVATSALMQVPMVWQTLPPGRRVGIVTISRAALSEAHLAAAGVPPGTPIVGTDAAGPFARSILGDEPAMDVEGCREDVLEAARTLVAHHGDVGAVVLECTNMAPHARDVRIATGLPVFSIHSLVMWFQSALSPPAFPQGLGDPRPTTPGP